MEYKIIYSKRKTLELRIVDGVPVVRAPMRTKRSIIDIFVREHENWIIKNINKQKEKEAMIASLTDADIKMLKTAAKVYFKEKVLYYSNIMNLNPSRVTITSAMKRFGSCSSTGNISFSYRLMLYPEEAREYVVVHELAHLREMNHSRNFYRIIESILPDYKERKRLLK